jgi:hypothetical protein
METKQRCQSCGMPLGDSFYGTNVDKSMSAEYCTFCFQNGKFTNPNQTLEEMIASSVVNMTGDLRMPVDKAQELARNFIPTLGRWKK